jgi:hypothetical protein
LKNIKLDIMTTNTKEAITKLVAAIGSFMLEALILKWIWNGVGPEQGLTEITWLAAMGWMVIGKTVLGTGAIRSAIADANKKKS